MSFLKKLFGKKDDFSFEDVPATGYDPSASQHKVNSYLNNQNASDSFGTSGTSQNDGFGNSIDAAPDSFSDSSFDTGLPPDPNSQGRPTDPFEASQGQQVDPFANLTQPNAQMPSGATGSQMANDYIKKQDYMARNQPLSQSQGGSKEEEIINLKLDSMKNQLDAINQRMQKIEQLLQSNANKRW